MADDSDPVIASYDVYLTQPHAANASTATDPTNPSSKIFVLQYPAHRPLYKPYNAARSQKPLGLRFKPQTGLVELDIPILTSEHYNADAGTRYGKAVGESRTMQAGGSHGLAGGFSTGPAQVPNLRDIPDYDTAPELLQKQTLGGKIAKSSERDPVYMLGSFRNNELHLSHLDAVIQLRPQLHHIDADEENNQKRYQPGATGKPKPGLESAPAKLESKAIEIKIKDSKDDGKDRNLNENARLLRDIQMDQWRQHDWVDQDDDASRDKLKHIMQSPSRTSSDPAASFATPKLKSSISNGDWLDKMSAPREDGKKGLLAKLRGRERERARRKKAEEEKRHKLKEKPGASASSMGPLMDMSSATDSDSSDESDGEAPLVEKDADESASRDVEMLESDDVEIKQEPAAPPATSVPKKRGRPKKSQPSEALLVHD